MKIFLILVFGFCVGVWFQYLISSIFNRESPEDKRIRTKGNRLRELDNKKVLTMDEENEKRILIGYPHLLEVVKEKCPKCGGEMLHDNFEKCWDENMHLKAFYKCIKCKYKGLFDLFTNKYSQIGGKPRK